jgi:hypothetical protein
LLLGTTVLHYSQNLQQNNQLLLFVTIGYAAALASVLRDKSSWAIVSGLALGAAFLIRMTSFIHIITVLLFFLGCLLYSTRDKFKIVRRLGEWIIGLMPLIVLGRIIDYYRFGSFWVTGTSLTRQQWSTDPIFARLPKLPENYPFTNPPWVGIWGALFSPAKSIFIYDPLLLPCLVLGIFLWKKLSPYLQWYFVTAMLNLCLHIAFYSRLDFWHGDGTAWGARYHVTSVHLLLIPLIALYIKYLLGFQGLRRWVLSGIIAIAILVQIPSIVFTSSVNGGEAYGAKLSSFNRFRLGDRIVTVGCLINASFTSDCPSRSLIPGEPLIQKVTLLPFNFTQRRELVFMAWGAVLVAAIASTYRFYRIG